MGYRRTRHRRTRLHGFNNLTKIIHFNLYDFVVARTQDERESYRQWVDTYYNATELAKILTEVAAIIDAKILSISEQDYDPEGASALVLLGDESHQSAGTAVAAHLDKSHLSAHTYPDSSDPEGVCSVRLDISVATCGNIVPLRALDHLLRSLSHDVVIVDYSVRGYTRDEKGHRVFMDHSLRSIQDYINPEIRSRYLCEDLILEKEHIWQTKMLIKDIVAQDFFKPGTDPNLKENQAALERVKREMAGVFHGWPSMATF